MPYHHHRTMTSARPRVECFSAEAALTSDRVLYVRRDTMNRITTFARTIPGAVLTRSLAVVTALVISVICAHAQTSATDGTTPAALAAGAPAGSYSLSDFERINLFNGNLNANFR